MLRRILLAAAVVLAFLSLAFLGAFAYLLYNFFVLLQHVTRLIH